MDLLMSWLQQGLGYLGPLIILLGLLIFVHELGHFLVAKFYGVRVEVFSLGFGKKLWQHKKGDTVYCVSMIPLGGYVKMYGDDPSKEIPEDQKPFSFLHKPVWPRIAIVLAGPLMNLFFAFVLFVAIAFIGQKKEAPVLGDITEDTRAYELGFRSGDKILSLDGKSIFSFSEVRKIIKESPNQELVFKIERHEKDNVVIKAAPMLSDNEDILSREAQVGSIEGLTTISKATMVGVPDPTSPAARSGLKTKDIILTVNGKEVNYWRELEPAINASLKENDNLTLGLTSYEGTTDKVEKNLTIESAGANLNLDEPVLPQLGIEAPELYLLEVKEDSPAEAAGLKSGDKILSLNGEGIGEWSEVIETVKSYTSSMDGIDFQVLRDGKEQKLKIKPEMTSLMSNQGQEIERFTVGILPAMVQSPATPVLFRTNNPLTAMRIGFVQTYDWTIKMVLSIVRLIEGRISSKNIGGVITIGRFASKSFEVGLAAFLHMMAIISLNLFLVNLLPVPVLDGGHLLFFSIEALKGAPLSMRKMEIAQQVGLIILMTLMAFALFNDFRNLLDSPW